MVVSDNEIHAPNGPSLYIYGYGYMQIVDNALVSEGLLPTPLGSTNVSIVSASALQNFVSPASFAALRAGALQVAVRATKVTVAGKVVTPDKLETVDLSGAKIAIAPEVGVIDAIFLPPPGAIMFDSNQVITSTPEIAAGFSTLITGNVDVAVLGNQFESNAPSAPTQVGVLGSTLRVENNRCADHSLVYSLVTYGMFNITAHNICDHCISVGASHQVVNQPNLEVSGGLCKAFGGLFPNLGGVKV